MNATRQYYLNLIEMLAFSMTYFSREEWEPVADAVGFNKSTSSASQATTQQQVGAETGTTTGGVQITGAQGVTQAAGSIRLGAVTAKNGTVNVTSSDPDVTQAALAAGVLDTQLAVTGSTTDAQDAIAGNSAVSQAAIVAGAAESENADALAGEVSGGAISLATTAIQSATEQQLNNDAFGEQALQVAENAEATSTGDVENLAAQYAQGLANATTNDQISTNDAATGAGQPLVTTQLPTTAQESGWSLSTVATWVAIAAGVVTILYYVKKKAI